MTFVPIRSRRRAKQLVSFEGIEFGERLWPTDFDALIEWRDKAWLVFEVKLWDKDVPYGQKLALERFVRDVRKAGKHAVAAVVQHHVEDPEVDVRLSDCEVREVFVSGQERWRPPDRPMTAQELADGYIRFVEGIRRDWRVTDV